MIHLSLIHQINRYVGNRGHINICIIYVCQTKGEYQSNKHAFISYNSVFRLLTLILNNLIIITGIYNREILQLVKAGNNFYH